ncbi:MAG: IS630 family transposase [Anaerolineaceae bacterium]|nr:IS630 family transposase [Anaerolineaceae bacterium]
MVFVDEAGLMLSPLVKRSWAPKGQTPILKTKTRSHRKISAIGGLTTSAGGRKQGLVFRLHPGKNVGASECVAFLEQLELNFPRRHIFVIWDGLRAHWSKKVSRWAAKHSKFQLFKLPPYAPELNPIEYVWANIKYHQLANLAPESEEELFVHAKGALCSARRNKNLMRSCLQHAPINFFGK